MFSLLCCWSIIIISVSAVYFYAFWECRFRVSRRADAELGQTLAVFISRNKAEPKGPSDTVTCC